MEGQAIVAIDVGHFRLDLEIVEQSVTRGERRREQIAVGVRRLDHADQDGVLQLDAAKGQSVDARMRILDRRLDHKVAGPCQHAADIADDLDLRTFLLRRLADRIGWWAGVLVGGDGPRSSGVTRQRGQLRGWQGGAANLVQLVSRQRVQLPALLGDELLLLGDHALLLLEGLFQRAQALVDRFRAAGVRGRDNGQMRHRNQRQTPNPFHDRPLESPVFAPKSPLPPDGRVRRQSISSALGMLALSARAADMSL